MEITLNPFDEESISQAVKVLEDYIKSLEAKQGVMIDHALLRGAEVANQIYAQHPGDHGVGSATGSRTGATEGVLTATAPDGEIGFIEFGTGIRHDEWGRRFGGQMPPYSPDPHGSYGLHQGENPGYWWYGNEYTDGRDPADAMLYARQAMIESILDDAREVFRT